MIRFAKVWYSGARIHNGYACVLPISTMNTVSTALTAPTSVNSASSRAGVLESGSSLPCAQCVTNSKIHRPATMLHPTAQHALEAFDYLHQRLPASLQSPQLAIICGSGLGGLADVVVQQQQQQSNPNQSTTAAKRLRVEIPYAEIPHFPQSQGVYWTCMHAYSVPRAA